MKILFITDLYPVKSEEKTTPKTLYNFVKEWKNFGHTVDIIKPNFILNSFLRKKPFYKTGKYDDIYNINYWTPFWFDVKKKYSFSSNYDLVIAHMPSGILYADKLGLPFVAGIHNSDIEVLTNNLYRFHFKNRLEKALINSKAIACRSYVIKEKLLTLYPKFEEKVFVAASGIDEDIISNYSNIRPFNSPVLKILTCANIKKRKNIDKLILACKEIDNIELTVIGDGENKNQLKKLGSSVKFMGRLNQKNVLEEMQNNDIFILPSVAETFGMVYLEAMAKGCITVCTKGDGIDGIIKDGENGFLTEPTVEGIKNVILKIKNLDVSTFNMVKNNSHNTILGYTSTKCAENYLQQIFKIL